MSNFTHKIPTEVIGRRALRSGENLSFCRIIPKKHLLKKNNNINFPFMSRTLLPICFLF